MAKDQVADKAGFRYLPSDGCLHQFETSYMVDVSD